MFNKDTIKLLFEEAQSLGLKPSLLTEYGLMSITIDAREHYVFHGTSTLNTQLSAYFSSNKHVTRVILERHNLPNIPYCLPDSYQQAAQFYAKYKPIISKPTLGRHSQGVQFISKIEDIKTINLNQSILEQFVKGQEERHLILNGEVLAVHKKVYTGPINDPNTVNRVSLEAAEWNAERTALAIEISSILGLSFAAVDFIVTDSKTYVLEVNSAPGLFRFQHPDAGPAINIAKIFLEATLGHIKKSSVQP